MQQQAQEEPTIAEPEQGIYSNEGVLSAKTTYRVPKEKVKNFINFIGTEDLAPQVKALGIQFLDKLNQDDSLAYLSRMRNTGIGKTGTGRLSKNDVDWMADIDYNDPARGIKKGMYKDNGITFLRKKAINRVTGEVVPYLEDWERQMIDKGTVNHINVGGGNRQNEFDWNRPESYLKASNDIFAEARKLELEALKPDNDDKKDVYQLQAKALYKQADDLLTQAKGNRPEKIKQITNNIYDQITNNGQNKNNWNSKNFIREMKAQGLTPEQQQLLLRYERMDNYSD